VRSSISNQALLLHHTAARFLSLLLLITLLSLLAPVTARSQENTAGADIDDSDVYIEEIIVIAQRRERPLQDVPISLSVFDSSEIEALRLTNIAGVASHTPNLVWDQSFLGAGNFSAIFVRGIGQSASFFESSADPAVGVYQDGVYIGRAIGSVLGIHDVDQI